MSSSIISFSRVLSRREPSVTKVFLIMAVEHVVDRFRHDAPQNIDIHGGVFKSEKFTKAQRKKLKQIFSARQGFGKQILQIDQNRACSFPAHGFPTFFTVRYALSSSPLWLAPLHCLALIHFFAAITKHSSPNFPVILFMIYPATCNNIGINSLPIRGPDNK